MNMKEYQNESNSDKSIFSLCADDVLMAMNCMFTSEQLEKIGEKHTDEQIASLIGTGLNLIWHESVEKVVSSLLLDK